MVHDREKQKHALSSVGNMPADKTQSPDQIRRVSARRILQITVILVCVVVVASVVFAKQEGVGFGDAVYQSLMTISTIGYGDYVPTTTLSKVSTSILAFIGVGAFFAYLHVILLSIRE